MNKGLFNKYIISRTDGTPIDPENKYFVLKLDGEGNQKHIDACRKAIITYAENIKDFHPELADELISMYAQVPERCGAELNRISIEIDDIIGMFHSHRKKVKAEKLLKSVIGNLQILRESLKEGRDLYER